jgi:hypothetical protein
MATNLQDLLKTTPKKVETPPQKKEDRFCTLNFPYKFLMGDGSWLRPDAFGIYHPKNKAEEDMLLYQMTKGFVYKESQLVPPEPKE